MRKRRIPSKITAERLREVWNYDPETGHVTWAKKTNDNIVIGARVGGLHCGGYIQATQQGELHLLHRLIWLYVHGKWPPVHIDHINGNRSDNRFANLRLADSSQNSANQRRRVDNASGVRGVYWSEKRKIWVAQIWWRGRRRYLGQYASLETAAEAYRSAAMKVFGDFVRQDEEAPNA